MSKLYRFLKHDFPERFYLFPIVLFTLAFLYRIIDMSKIIYTFPFELINDVSSYMAMLHFFYTYGYHAVVPNWYNGFILFSTYPPGAFFVLAPLLAILKDVKLTFFVGLLLLYLIGFFLLRAIGNLHHFSSLQRIAFYTLYFFNPIALSHYVRVLRLPSLVGDLFLLGLFYLLYVYLDKEITWSFLAPFALLYAALLLTHPPEFILFNIFLFGFFLVKPLKEKLFVVVAPVLGLLLSSFWFIPFLKTALEHHVPGGYVSNLITFSTDNLSTQLSNFVIPLFLLIFFFFYLKTHSYNKKLLLLYGPVVILAFLHLLRLTFFIPLIEYVYNQPYMAFFIFFLVYFLLAIDYKQLSSSLRTLFALSIVFGSIVAVIFGFVFTSPFLVPSTTDQAIVSVMHQVTDGYLLLGDFPKNSYNKAFYSYGAIYLNLSTPAGWVHQDARPDHLALLDTCINLYDKRDCEAMKGCLRDLQTPEIISISDGCSYFTQCGYSLVQQEGNVCLVRDSLEKS